MPHLSLLAEQVSSFLLLSLGQKFCQNLFSTRAQLPRALYLRFFFFLGGEKNNDIKKKEEPKPNSASGPKEFVSPP